MSMLLVGGLVFVYIVLSATSYYLGYSHGREDGTDQERARLQQEMARWMKESGGG